MGIFQKVRRVKLVRRSFFNQETPSDQVLLNNLRPRKEIFEDFNVDTTINILLIFFQFASAFQENRINFVRGADAPHRFPSFPFLIF